ncbi:MAG: 50S ribosomal protein L21 [Minisyncoccota bacterium]
MAEAVATKKTKAPKAPKAVSTEATQSAPKSAPKTSKKAAEGSKTAFAIIGTGGKQYRVSEGQRLKIEKLLGDHKEGDSVVFRDVLLKGDGSDLKIGTPHVAGSSVHGTITKISRYKTVDVIKYKQKSRYFKKYGHRQPYFEVQIDSIK